MHTSVNVARGGRRYQRVGNTRKGDQLTKRTKEELKIK